MAQYRFGLQGWRVALWGLALVVFVLPLVAMRFSGMVMWDKADFAAWGAMVLGACLAFEAAVKLTGKTTHRAVLALAIAAVFILVWVELAVGILD